MSIKDLYNKNGKSNSDIEDDNESYVSEDIDVIQEIEESQQTIINERKNYSILNALLVSLLVISVYFTYRNVTDDSIMVYQCPITNDLDGASKLTQITDGRTRDYETLIRGEIRKFIRAMYPKNALEAKYLWEYAYRHSKGSLKDDFEEKLEYLDKQKDQFRLGNVTSVYPSVPSDEAISIRESGGGWNVSIPVRRVKRFGATGDERIEPTIKMRIESYDPHIEGSESGLYVTDFYLSYVPDSISGKEIILKN